ncbi:hypothetical protein GGX14DRAFT_578945 [Mycena pura]|uniref:Uncharacterized protein n=1 Tax=Mycena pura TaxID=153505 RepID=A0AAD6URV9_9AGAR|nr:hypothetical protein GGX14DRAFT_578945 [Mycena pura]
MLIARAVQIIYAELARLKRLRSCVLHLDRSHLIVDITRSFGMYTSRDPCLIIAYRLMQVIYATFARRRSQTLFALLLTSGAICSPIHPAIQVVDDSQLGNNHSCRWYASIPVRVIALLLTAHTVLTCLATHSFIEISHTTIMIQVFCTSHFLICPVTHSLIETPAIPATHEL